MNKKDKVECDDMYKSWYALNRRFQWLSSYYKSLNKEKMVKESLQQKLNRLLKTEDVVNFTFKKKNGELRHARGTKKMDKIESIDEGAIPSGKGTPKTGVIAYFDLDKSAWRSFQEESLVSIETQESDDMFI